MYNSLKLWEVLTFPSWFWDDRAVLQSLLSIKFLSFLKRKFVLKPPITRGKLTIQPHGPVSVAMALCIHSLTTPGQPTGVLQSL